MIGMLIGTVCAVGLVSMVRRARRRMGGGCGYGGGGYGGRRGYGRRGWFLRSLFERLDTTPGQEKAIMSALDELRENRAALREELEQTRSDLAHAVRGGLIDDATLEESFARHDRLLARVRVSFVEAAKRATEALDERQRQTLAQFLEGRGWGRVWV
jgi:Spy/CpxP family protein refolding chaperone